ncbi:MAG: hypothetical protein AAGF32_02745 [Pseudomonadota bacterium]
MALGSSNGALIARNWLSAGELADRRHAARPAQPITGKGPRDRLIRYAARAIIGGRIATAMS